MNEFVSCIVAAGGSGTRMGAGKNKVFLKVDGIPVIALTLSALDNCDAISEIIVATREEDIVEISGIAKQYNIKKLKIIVKGGETRAESVLAASKEVSSECDFVMIHDAARPFVTDEIICETVNKSKENGAAACGVKPKCTLKAVDNNGVITDTVDRERTIEIQTPQVFCKGLFDKMYSFETEILKTATDDCVLAEKCGAEIFVTNGSYKNIKITTPEDMEIAEIFLRRK